ncbi:MAG: NAD(P)-dependent oxidoreductase [Elusimicrobia bacterium]|nr:NAD(P)-dependent oxidoreductase [Elusimicrobiota bacterium]
MKETALVTGACGFVGSHLTELLLEKGYEVVASDHPKANPNGLKGRVKYVPVDLTDIKSIEALNEYKFDKVFHVAGLFDCFASWESLYAVNCEGMKKFLEVLSRQKSNIKSIIIWSSGAIYGRSCRREAVKETEPPQPINNYEKSKLIGEQIAMKFHAEQGLPVTVVRPAAIYGPRSKYGLAVSVFMIKKGLLRFIPGKGDCVGAYIHVHDVAAAAEFLSARPQATGQIFNIADDSAMPLEDAILLAASLLKVWMLPVHFPVTPIKITAVLDQTFSRLIGKRPMLEPDLIAYLDRDSWMDNSKLKATGYQLKYPTLKDGMPPTVEWYKKEGWI